MVLKVYLAAGFFNQHQILAVDYLEKFLDSKKEIKLFSPRRETKLNGNEDKIVMKKTFDANLNAIKNSDLVIASTIDKDIGTSIECGFAIAHHIPIIYTLFDSRLVNPIFNLMAAQSGLACFTNSEEFEKYINELLVSNKFISKDYIGEFE